MTSKILPLQKDNCADDQPEQEVPKFCPTCTPDPSYVQPKWWTTRQPYLNKKTCEYSTSVSINESGDIYTHSTISKSGMSFSDLMKTYVKTGIDYLVSHYNKEEVTNIDGIPLEQYGNAMDYHFSSFADSSMSVLITIPASAFDRIPEKPVVNPQPDQIATKVLRIGSRDLFKYLKELKSSTYVYSKFQAIFFQLEGGRVIHTKTKEPFYLKFYQKRIQNMIGELETLLEKNNYDFGLFSSPLKEAEEMEFTFEYSSNNETYKVKKIRAKKRFRDFKVLKGMGAWNRSNVAKNPTLMGYLANIKTIHLRLNGRKSPPWTEFVELFTYPRVEIVSKNTIMGDTGLKCLNEQLSNLDDFIFDQVINFADAFAFQLNKNNKTTSAKINATPRDPDQRGIDVSEISRKMAKERNKPRIKTGGLERLLKSFSISSSEDALREVLSNLSICKWTEICFTACTCIMSNLDLETSFSAIAKQAFKSITAEGLEIMLLALPPAVRSSVEEEILELLGNAAPPWDSNFDGGSDEDNGSIGVYLIDGEQEVLIDQGDIAAGPRPKSKKEVMDIYESAIMKHAELQQIMNALQNLPGADIIANFITSVDFPSTHFITPTISSFLNSLSFDPCGLPPVFTLPRITLPYPSFSFSGFNWRLEFGKIFFAGLKLTIKQLMIGLLRLIIPKIAIPGVLDLDCKSLIGAVGKGSDALTQPVDLKQMLTDAICSDPLGISESENFVHRLTEAAGVVTDSVKNTAAEALKAAAIPVSVGSPGNTSVVGAAIENLNDRYNFDERAEKATGLSQESATRAIKDTIWPDSDPYNALVKAISVSSTKIEVVKALTLPTEEQDMAYFGNMSRTLPNAVPEFASSLDTPEKCQEFFTKIGNMLTREQAAAIQQEVTPDEGVTPLEETICLTPEDLENWNRERQTAFENSGLSPEIAKDFVDKQNDRIKDDLDDMLDLFANGSDTLKDSLDKAMKAFPDEECEDPNSLINFKNSPVETALQQASNSMFDRLRSAFIDDTIEWNFFERLWDTPGILSLILADKRGFTLNYHNAVNESAILKFFLPNPGDDPPTVSKQMFDYIRRSKFEYKNEQVMLTYSNGLEDDNIFTSAVRYSDKPNSLDSRIVATSPLESVRFKTNKPALTDYDKQFLPSTNPKNMKTAILNEYLKRSWSGVAPGAINSNAGEKFLSGMNNILFDKLSKEVITKDGSPSDGFVYSAVEQKITKADLTYVSPDGSEYNFEEDDAVLGRSQTNNPRVVFLDPSSFGGSYLSPKYYIKPQEQVGWKKFAKIIMPSSVDKGDAENFINIPTIVARMDKVRGMEPDPRLQLPPEEIQEIPFDKIASPVDFSAIEGSIIATIRVHLADFFIRAMPVLSNVKFDMDNNFDDIVSEFIANSMKVKMTEQNDFLPSVYSGYVYWLLFLEQAVQIFDRNYKRAVETSPDTISDSLKTSHRSLLTILASQQNHFVDDGNALELLKRETRWNIADDTELGVIRAKKAGVESAMRRYQDVRDSPIGLGTDLSKETEAARKTLDKLNEQETIEIIKKKYGNQVVRGSLILGHGQEYWKNFNLSKSQFQDAVIRPPTAQVDDEELYGFVVNNTFQFDFSRLKHNEASFASKIFTVNSVEGHCVEILKFLVREQIQEYRQTMEDQTNPHIEDIHKYFIGASGIFPHSPKIGIQEESYSNIVSCVHNPEAKNPLDGQGFSNEDYEFVNENGTLFLEKYVRVIDKPDSPLSQRSDLLKGVVNPQKFMEFLKSKQREVDTSKPVSEYFGDAIIAQPQNEEGEEVLVGSVGIKYGVRLCYVPPEGSIDVSKTPTSLLAAKQNKSFIMKPAEVTVLPEVVGQAFELAKENSDEAMALLTVAIPTLGAALAIAGIGGDEFEKVIEIVEGLVPTLQLNGSENIYPICSYEHDLQDLSLSHYINLPDDRFDQDMKCLVDNLLNTESYKLIFDKILNVKKVPSIMSIYSYMNFLAALGLDPSEREESDESQINANNVGKVFNDSHKELKKLFLSSYIRKDFDQEDDEGSRNTMSKQSKDEKMQETLEHSPLADDVPWFSKFKRSFSNPFDKFGDYGWNKYRKLFKF